MYTIGIRLPAADMAAELAAMRKWLDEHGWDPTKFEYNRYGNTLSVYVTFEQEAAAKAFRSRWDDQQRHRASDGLVLLDHRWVLDFDGSSSGTTNTDTMARACWCRLMAEEVRAEADGFNSGSATDLGSDGRGYRTTPRERPVVTSSE
jgi:hypothetical protein